MSEAALGNQYSPFAKFLHWLIAIVAMVMLLGVFYIDFLPDSMMKTFFLIHKATGVVILFLMMIRIGWLLEKGRPKLPGSIPIHELCLAKIVQYSMYCFMLIMPLSGWIMATAAGRAPNFYGLFNMPLPYIPKYKPLASAMSQLHELTAWILIVLIVLHILGALKHHFMDKDGVMRSMI